MHIVLLAAEDHSPTGIAQSLFCSRTTLYSVVDHFVREKQAAFLDRERDRPKPSLDEPANERIEERLVQEDSLTEHGWLRSEDLRVPRHTVVQGGSQPSEKPKDASLRAPSARLALEKATSRGAEKDSEDLHEKEWARLEDILLMVEKAGSFFQDETKLKTNPKVDFCWMCKGSQRLLCRRLRTSGTNRDKLWWISGALNFFTGRFHWVLGKPKNDELFIALAFAMNALSSDSLMLGCRLWSASLR